MKIECRFNPSFYNAEGLTKDGYIVTGIDETDGWILAYMV